MVDTKKFLDSNGLTYFCKKFQDYPSNEILSTVINAIDATKVDKENGKVLSSNDYTNEDKNKLNNSLLYIAQTLTEEQQKQVKQNLNLTNDVVPSIGDNGNWFIGKEDTGISAVFNTVPVSDIDKILDGKIEETGNNLAIYPVQYYRIEFTDLYRTDTSSSKPTSACLTELEFYDRDGNKISPAFIEASSIYSDSATYNESKLYDGNFNTMWSSKDLSELQWLEICLNKSVVLQSIKIYPRNKISLGVPNALTFYASENKIEWQQIGYYENLKDTWVDEYTAQEFSLNPYKTDISTNKKVLDFSGLRYYHNKHGVLKADINSPNFTGVPTANTPEITDNSNRLATTEFIQKLFSDSHLDEINKELSLKAHKKRMEEWKNLGLGLFIHWGVYSAWDGKYSGTNELGEEVNIDVKYNAEWLLCNSKMPPNVYKEKSSKFTGELWNAEEIAKMAYRAGMKYIVITSKHHEGFSLFPNENSSWDINDTPCRNTILQELKDACDRYGLKFCLYFSQCYDWTEEGGFGKETPQYLGTDPWTEEQHMAYMEKTINSIKYLVKTYDPFVLWYDMGYSNNKYSQILYEAQELYWPNVIVNDRLAADRNLYGDFRTTERVPGDGTNEYSEACFTLNNTWGYNSSNDTLSSYNGMNLETIFKTYIIDSLGNGQNCLLNIGPKPNGSIPTMQKSRLKFMANFFSKYGTLTGAKPANKICYPDWGYALKINEKTLRCFIYEPNNNNINLYGFDPTYIKSVRVFGAKDEYSTNNYEITEYGIKLLVDKLNSYSYDEEIADYNTSINNNANIGVVEIEFNQPVIMLEAKPIGLSENLQARNFSISNGSIKSYKIDEIKIPKNGNCYAEFIWTGDSGSYSIKKSISSVEDTSTAGVVTITKCVDGSQTIINLDNLSLDDITNNVILLNGFRYGININRVGGSTNKYMILSRISFEPNADFEITYTEVDHITAKSKQYIDTDYLPNNNTKVEIDVMQLAKNNTRASIIVGLESPKFIIGTDTSANKIRFDFGDFSEQLTSSTYTILNTRYILTLDKGTCYVNGESVGIDLSSSSAFQATNPLRIFGDAQYSDTDVRFLGNLYGMKIWENNELVRDFIPVKRDYDGIYGLLDRVNNKFYRSMTSTDFTCE